MNFLRKYWPIIVLIVVGLALYASSFQNEMFWDDDDGILKNAFVKDWQYLPQYFSENLIAGANLVSNYWRPVLLIIYSIEWHLWQDWAPGYHIINTIAHIGAAILLFYLLRKLFKRQLLAFLTAFIFLIHPLQTEAVTYISALGDSLSSVLMLAGLLLYLRIRDTAKTFWKVPSYYFSLLFFALALMTKEPSIVMPALVILADYFYQQGSALQRLKKIVWPVLPFIAIDGVYTILRATILNFHNTFNVYGQATEISESFFFRLKIFFFVLVEYFKLMFAPIGLHMERGYEVLANINTPQIIIGALLTVALLTTAFWQINRNPVISFGIFWFFLRLSPNSNLIVPNSGLMYEHWLYLPLAGIFLALFYVLLKLAKNEKIFYTLAAIFILFAGFLSVQTIKRNAEWRDAITFYEQTVQYAPQSYKIVNNLGMAYAEAGKDAKAEATYKKAIELDPQNSVGHHNLANLYASQGKIELAEAGYLKALEIDPGFIFSKNSLGRLYLSLARYELARDGIEAAIGYLEKLQALFPDEKGIQAEIEQLRQGGQMR